MVSMLQWQSAGLPLCGKHSVANMCSLLLVYGCLAFAAAKLHTTTYRIIVGAGSMSAAVLQFLQVPLDKAQEAGRGGQPQLQQQNKQQQTQSVPGPGGTQLKFMDTDEHVYFWFPLLAGLSELTFDPRQEIRHSALEVSLAPVPMMQMVHL
jgi:hypothetical protein